MVNLQKKFKQGSRALIMVCLVLSVMSVPMLASAEVHYQVGIKSFLTDMKMTFTDTLGEKNTVKSDNSVALVGPSVKIMGDAFFAGATYLLPSKKLQFDSVDIAINRQDLDVFVGMMPLRGENFKLGVVLGYKGIFLDYTAPVNNDFTATSSFNGGMLGMPISYRLPINAVPIVLYLTPAYGFLYEKFKNGDFHESHDYLGYSVDGGVNVGIWRGLSATIGYKYQAMDTAPLNSDTEKADQKLEFKGLNFGLDYTF